MTVIATEATADLELFVYHQVVVVRKEMDQLTRSKSSGQSDCLRFLTTRLKPAATSSSNLSRDSMPI